MKRDMRVVIKLDRRRIADMLCTRGCDYWAEFDGVKVRVRIDDSAEHAGKKYVLTDSRLRRGMQLMAIKYPRHFADYLAENDDAETADVLVQLACFGELIYG